MTKKGPLIVYFGLSLAVCGQQMEVNKFNCHTFSVTHADISEELKQLTPVEYHHHPEFGQLPYNAPCENCYELLQYRSDTTRLFVEKGSEGTKFYSQASYGLVSYLDESGNYISYDHRLKPSDSPGTFIADKQGVPVGIDANLGQSVFYFPGGGELKFNQNLSLYHYSAAGDMTDLGAADWTNYTAGEDGARITDAWPGIDVELHVRLGEVKTNYIIHSNQGLSDGYLVFKDDFTVPGNCEMIIDPEALPDPVSGKLIGSVSVQNGAEVVATVSPAFGFDNSGIRENTQLFGYEISNGDLETWVPVDWLNAPGMVYPLTIDPLVTASATYTAGIMRFRYNGSFCGGPGADCMYTLSVPRPANATLTGATFSIVHETLFGSCFSVCWMSDAGFYFSTTCGVNGHWGCSANSAGTCTGTNLDISNLIDCLPPACSGNVNFNIFNSYCYCSTGGACGNSCQRINNNTWVVTISGRTLETLGNTATGNGSQTINDADCAGTTVLDPAAANGVPGYTYSWTNGATTPTITVNNTPGVYTCTVTDACGVQRTATFNMGCPLPVRLDNFEAIAAKQTVLVKWQTLSEINSDYFFMQRAGESGIFESVAKLDAQENSSETRYYAWTDKAPLSGSSYYRIAMYDQDGSVEYSEVKSVTMSFDENQVQIVPNPNGGVFNITCAASHSGEATIDILAPGGKVMKSTTFIVIKGTQTIAVDCSELPKGVYVLRYSTDDKTTTQRLIIE